MSKPNIKEQYNTHNTSGKMNSKEYIVLHHTGTKNGTIKSVLNWLTSGPVSCHFVIDTNGDIYQIGTPEDVLRHCGISIRKGKKNLNQYSIGIELIGPLPGFTSEQRRSLRILVRRLCKTYKIPAHNIIRHKDIAPGRKVDVDDALRNNHYENFSHYQQSFMQSVAQPNYYEKLYQKHFGSKTDPVIKDPTGAVQKLAPNDPVLTELIYFICIGLEVARNKK